MSDLMITGVIDGPLPGGLPKAIQVTVLADIADLSIYGLGAANNGGGTDGEEFTFPSVSASAGDVLYLASEAVGFEQWFGFAPDYVDNDAAINGDDAIELFQNGLVVDLFGVIDVDGNGEPWEYLDGWASRDAALGPNPVFNVADWTFSGPNALDGETSNDTAANPFPTGGTGGEPLFAINELRVNSSGSSDNTSNFVEIFTEPGTSLDGKTLVVISGEFAPGQIDLAIDLTGAVADADGFVLIANADNPELEAGDVAVTDLDFFNSPATYLIVDNFTGAVGDDLDPGDAGELDITPWDAVLDSVSLVDGDAIEDASYSETIIGPDGNFLPAGAARSVDGTGAFEQLSFGDTSGDTPGSTNDPEIPVQQLTIMEIQGAGHVSGLVSDTPLDPTTGGGAGERVLTTGIVTAIDSNGFYMQDPDGDGNIATSDAIFVFTGSAPTVAIGDALEVEGTVSEFYPGGQGSRNLSTTQLGGNPEITVVSSGNALPEAILLGQTGRLLPSETIEDDGFTSFDPTTDGIDFYESLEGMLVTAVAPVAVSGTSQFDEIFVVVDGGADATGISDRGTLNISPDDFNPEKVQIDFDFGIEPVIVDTGATFSDITGVISYDFGNYQINPTEVVVVIEESLLEAEVTELASSATELTIASYNVLNLDPVVEDIANVPGMQSRNVDDDVGDGRFEAIANQIVNNLGSPDIIALQEIQDNTGGETGDGVVSADVTLQTLIDAIDLADDGVMNDSSGYAYVDNTFITDLASGGQPGGNIRTAFLYKEDRVSLVEGSVGTIGSQDPGGSFEGARLPLVATFDFNGEEVTVVNNHFSSKGGSAPIMGVEQEFAELQEDPNVNGSLDERQAQSEAVNGYVTDLLAEDAEANVVVLGDLNEFEFVSPVTGLEENLTNLTDMLDEDERYSFNFQGNSQQIDHILISDSLLEGGAQFDVVHVNSEFAATPGRASDHDPVLAQLTFEAEPPETVEVAVEFFGIPFFWKTAVVETVDGQFEGFDLVRNFSRDISFDESDISVSAVVGDKAAWLRFDDGALGVRSSADGHGRSHWFDWGHHGSRSDRKVVNNDETLIFELEEGVYGDATEVTFDFARVDGEGDIALAFYDDDVLIEEVVVDASAGEATVGLSGADFDRVELGVVGDTEVSIDGFSFDRIIEDEFLIG